MEHALKYRRVSGNLGARCRDLARLGDVAGDLPERSLVGQKRMLTGLLDAVSARIKNVNVATCNPPR